MVSLDMSLYEDEQDEKEQSHGQENNEIEEVDHVDGLVMKVIGAFLVPGQNESKPLLKQNNAHQDGNHSAPQCVNPADTEILEFEVNEEAKPQSEIELPVGDIEEQGGYVELVRQALDEGVELKGVLDPDSKIINQVA